MRVAPPNHATQPTACAVGEQVKERIPAHAAADGGRYADMRVVVSNECQRFG